MKNTYQPTSFHSGNTYNERTDRFVGVDLTDPQMLVAHSRGVLSNNYVLQPTGRVETRDGYEQISESYFLRGVWDFVAETGESVRVALAVTYNSMYDNYTEYIGEVSYLHDRKFVNFKGDNPTTVMVGITEANAKTPAHAVSSNNRLYVLTGHGFYVFRIYMVGSTRTVSMQLVRESTDSHIPTTRYMGIARNAGDVPKYNNVTLEYPNLLSRFRKERYLLGLGLQKDNVFPAIQLGAKMADADYKSLRVHIDTLDEEGKAVSGGLDAIAYKLADTAGEQVITPDVFPTSNQSEISKFYQEVMQAGDYVLLLNDVVAYTKFIGLLGGLKTEDSGEDSEVKYTLRGKRSVTKSMGGTVSVASTATSSNSYAFGVYFTDGFVSYLHELGSITESRADLVSEFHRNSYIRIYKTVGGSLHETKFKFFDMFDATSGGYAMRNEEYVSMLQTLSNRGITDSEANGYSGSVVLKNGYGFNLSVPLTPQYLANANAGIELKHTVTSDTEAETVDFAVSPYANGTPNILDLLSLVANETVTLANLKNNPVRLAVVHDSSPVGSMNYLELSDYGGRWNDQGNYVIPDLTALIAAASNIEEQQNAHWHLEIYDDGDHPDDTQGNPKYIDLGESRLSRVFSAGYAIEISSQDGTSLEPVFKTAQTNLPSGWNSTTIYTATDSIDSADVTTHADWVDTYVSSGDVTTTTTNLSDEDIVSYNDALIYVDDEGVAHSRNEFKLSGAENSCCIGTIHQTAHGTEIYFFKDFEPEQKYVPNITVTYPLFATGDVNYTKQCKMIDEATSFARFGANNSLNRLWLYGYSKMPNYAIHSQEPFKGFNDTTGREEGDFSYFPDEGLIKFGEAENAIVGMGVVSTDSMAVIKNHHGHERTMFFVSPTFVSEPVTDTDSITREEYKTSLSNTSTAGLAKETIADVNGDLLFIGHEHKVVGLDIEGITGDSQRVANTRSYYIDAALSESNFDNARLFKYEDKIFLALKDKLYLSALVSKTEDTKQYEWWPCDPFPSEILSVNVLKDALWIGGKDGKVYTLRKISDADPETKDIKRIYLNGATGQLANFASYGHPIVDASVGAQVKELERYRTLNPSALPVFDKPLATVGADNRWTETEGSGFLKAMGNDFKWVIYKQGSYYYKEIVKVVFKAGEYPKFQLVFPACYKSKSGNMALQYSGTYSIYAVLNEKVELDSGATFVNTYVPDDEVDFAFVVSNSLIISDSNGNVIIAYEKKDMPFPFVDGVTKTFDSNDSTNQQYPSYWSALYRYNGYIAFVEGSGYEWHSMMERYEFYSVGAELNLDEFHPISITGNTLSNWSSVYSMRYNLILPRGGETFNAYRRHDAASNEHIFLYGDSANTAYQTQEVCFRQLVNSTASSPACYIEIHSPIVPKFASIRLSQAKIGYDKTIQNVTVWNDSKNPCELKVGALTNKNYLVAADNNVFDPGLGLSFDELNFEHTDFDKNEVPRLYNLKKFPRNQQTLTITFTASGKRNSVLAGLDILYHIRPARNKR